MPMDSRFRAGLSEDIFLARITGWELAGIQLLVLRGLGPHIHAFVSDARQTVALGHSWLFLQRNNSHSSTSSDHAAPPIGALSRSSMKPEHCGNFSVAHTATNRAADALRIIDVHYLFRVLAEVTGLSLYPVDTIKFRTGGGEIPHEEYLKRHADLLNRDQWIIDGFGCVASAWERFSAADTLVYIDLPLLTHFKWVTKRLVKGLFLNPEGWPEDSPIWSSTLAGYRVLWLCHRRLTPRQLVADAPSSKRVHHLKVCRRDKGISPSG